MQSELNLGQLLAAMVDSFCKVTFKLPVLATFGNISTLTMSRVH